MEETLQFLVPIDIGIAWWGWILVGLGLVAFYDIFINKKHTITHNYPIIGHLRYAIEKIGPEFRQYIVANNREERPFNRLQRGWVYSSSKLLNNYEGFGTEQDILEHQYIFIKQNMMPYKLPENHPNKKDPYFLPAAKVIGSHRRRPYRPKSIVNISAMSFGSLSAKAQEALNKGAMKADCFHNTGEGGLSPYHSYGADVVFHFGTGYFGVRNKEGGFSMDKMEKLVENNSFVRAIEVKLSQGAKPGKGGVLPGVKITAEIAKIRGVEIGKDVLSSATHKAFSNAQELIDFIEEIAEVTGLPVGIKAAIGKLDMWEELTDIMKDTGKGPDFVTIDGGEGGTGAAPPSFADHVSLPWVFGFSSIYKLFQSKGLEKKTFFMGSGKLGFPHEVIKAFAMGVDSVNIAREAMLSIGCIQAQICHTNKCPTGIATQNKWLQNGIDPTLKSERFYNYAKTLRKEVIEITHACGYEHPAQIKTNEIDFAVTDKNLLTTMNDIYKYDKTIVPLEGMQNLKDCAHLGGKG